MQQVWGTSPFQGRCYHQKPPGGPKDQDPMLKKVGSSTDINVTGWTVMKNIGESSRTFGERFKQHQKAHPHT